MITDSILQIRCHGQTCWQMVHRVCRRLLLGLSLALLPCVHEPSLPWCQPASGCDWYTKANEHDMFDGMKVRMQWVIAFYDDYI